MTSDEFTAVTGCAPVNDDLERANCKLAGKIGHVTCGVCQHGKPLFLCAICFDALFKHGHHDK